MRIIEPYFEILDELDGKKMLQKIERIGRVCYKSENLITEDSAEKFIGNILKRGHESVIEHEKISVKMVCDRGVTHDRSPSCGKLQSGEYKILQLSER